MKYVDVFGKEVIESTEVVEVGAKLSDEEVLEIIGNFASNIDDSGDGRVSAVTVEDSATRLGESTSENASDIATNNIASVNCSTLLSYFKGLMMVDSTSEFIANTLVASTFLSGVSTVKGSLEPERKVKSLFWR